MEKGIIIIVIISLILGLIIGLAIPTSKENVLPSEMENYSGEQFKEINYDWGIGQFNSTLSYDEIGAVDSLCKEELKKEIPIVDLSNTFCENISVQKNGDFSCDVYNGQVYDCFVPLNIKCTCWYPE
jgi:hypothetical protein